MGFTEATVFTLGVVMGTASTIIAKLIFDVHSVGLNGRYVAFGKPLMQTWLMFIGMSCALPMYLLDHYRRNRRPVKAVAMGDPESGTVDVVDPPIPWSTYISLLIPAAFDLIATALSGVGLMYCTVSVYQLVRCTVIIVTALLKVFVLGHRIPPYAWFGLFINTVAMVLVASTSFIEVAADEGANTDPRIGIFFVLLSCIVQGAQYVFEERVMATGDGAPPLLVVGMEGIWGFVLMVLVVLPTAQYLPGSDNGHMEDTWDSLEMMRNNSFLCSLLVVFTMIVFFYNVFCIYVTNLLNSIWHAILDNFRPITVWGTDLALFYLFSSGRYGEAWGLASWFELAGMALLIFGTIVYNANVHLSCFDYSQSDEDEEPLPAALSGASFTPGSPRNTQARRGSSPRVGESVGLLPDRPPKKKVMASSRAQGSAYGSSLGSD